MHELSIAISILEIAEEESEQRGNTAVEAIHLKLGAMSGVVKEALASAFELAVEQSAFPNCRLVIEEIPSGRELQVTALELAQ
jgi:hydrogenase nickel incorporation protein HypA/HybF